MEEVIPNEILCYIFTFLPSRRELKSISQVCWWWNEALTVEEVWRTNYLRFFGQVTPRIAGTIDSWNQTYRQRYALLNHLEKLNPPHKLITIDEKIFSARLLGGHNRPVLVFTSGTPKIYFLATGRVAPIPCLGARTCVYPSADGRRLLVGTAQGTIHIYQWYDKYTYPQIEKQDQSYDKIATSQIDSLIYRSQQESAAKRQEREQKRAQALVEVRARLEEATNRVRDQASGNQPLPAPQNQINQQLSFIKGQFEAQIARLQPLTPHQIAEEIQAEFATHQKNAQEWVAKLLPHNHELSHDLVHGGSYLPAGTFSDGHNHYYDMNVTIEQISENEKFVASLAHNNTVAIWEKTPPPYNAYGYLREDRQVLSSDGKTVPYGTRGPYLKSILFKYPPSLVYMMPGSDLMVIIGTATGKVLVWQTYTNYLLKAHSEPVVECLGFGRNESAYLATVSIHEEKSHLKVWDLTPGLDKLVPVRRPIAEAVLEGKLVSLKYDSSSELLVTRADTVSVWNPWELGSSTEMQPFFVVDKKVSCMQVDPNKGLLFLTAESGHTLIYFLRTGQVVAKLAPSKSNQYFSLFDIQTDSHTFIAVDDHCLHWKILGKSTYE